jgi:lipopolysaccharide biosynthesis glycosyltransferase
MNAECAVCYVADINFILPSLISAAGVRRYVPPHKAEIYVFAIDVDEARLAEINKFVDHLKILVVGMESRHFSGVDWERSKKVYGGRMPIATLGRFFLNDLLPSHIRRLVYLDGDTWIKDDPSAFIETFFPSGKFAAVDDTFFFCRNDLSPYGANVRSYFRGLGIDGGRGYFNAGVFAVERNSWRDIADQALRFFCNNMEICRFHDQSALNAVVGARRIRLSPAWNFQTHYRLWGTEARVNPAIYHFTLAEKPWAGPVQPWADVFSLYLPELTRFAPLGLPVERLTEEKVRAANSEGWRSGKWPLLSSPVRPWTRNRKLMGLLATSMLNRAAA